MHQSSDFLDLLAYPVCSSSFLWCLPAAHLLWCPAMQVQNGVALYTTLGSLVTLLNLTVFLQHQTGAARCDCAKLSLLLLLLMLLAW